MACFLVVATRRAAVRNSLRSWLNPDLPGDPLPLLNPSTALPMRRERFPRSPSHHLSMFNFSANHLTLPSRTEYRSCAVFMVPDHSTHRVYRLHDFTKAHAMEPGSYYCVSGKVNSADKLYLVTESVKPDAKHIRSPIAPLPVDGAER
jgi:hypothetical protein